MGSVAHQALYLADGKNIVQQTGVAGGSPRYDQLDHTV